MKNVAPSYSRGRDETSRTGPNAPLEPVQPDFACSASNEMKKLEMDVFRKPFYYFIPSLVAIVRGIYISLMRIGFLYYNCLGFDLFIWLQDDFILNTVAAVVYKRIDFTWSLCSSCTEEKC